jgi:hypothetical protein
MSQEQSVELAIIEQCLFKEDSMDLTAITSS